MGGELQHRLIDEIGIGALEARMPRAGEPLPLALFTTLYTNPFTIVPLYLAAFTIGEWILGGGGHFTAPPEWAGSWSGAGLLEWLETLAQWMLGLGRPLALGLITLASVLSATAYLLVRVVWRQYLVRAWQRRKKSRP